MTDSHDPFAERPYTPPAQRQPQPPAGETGEDTTEERGPIPMGPAPTGPVPTGPASGSSAPSPDEPREAHAPHASAPPPGAPHPGAQPAGPGITPGHGPAEHTSVLAPPPPPHGPTPPGSGQVPPAGRPRRGRPIAAAIGIVALALIAGFTGGILGNQFSDGGNSTSTSTGTSIDAPASSDLPAGTVEQVAQKIMPSVVQINFSGGGEGGSGSGVIISEDGKIVTNNHVVEAAADGGTLTVGFNDGTNARATIIGTDPATDIAVIQAEDVSGLETAQFGSSSDVRVGQEVVAIGSPFGLESTVTQGIVSALNRPVSPGDQSSSSDTLTTFPAIQTDAAINPGNSGGPLVDLEGRVIGINSAIRSSGGVEGGSIGLGFAIPSDLARNVSAQILDGKTVEHARIGITVQSATGDDQITGIGARVAEVESGGPGDEAGLREGDIVTAVNDHPVATNQALIATVRSYQPGDEVTLTIQRDGKQEDVKVTLGSDAGDLQR
ncbi:S1C family serine protease [Aeromicrobium piscarium]|nr:trypsin-like peptidase domain-containing protein [Aeromicrobium piscarium]